MANLERIVHFLDALLGIPDFPDYARAVNGLQVANRGRVARVVSAVDASEASIAAATAARADLMLVHHGLFWSGISPITGPAYRKVAGLVRGDVALYGAHLPLDAHPEVGNAALLAREAGVQTEEPFGTYEGHGVGWRGRTDQSRDGLREALAQCLGGAVRVIPGGPEQIRSVGVVTGGGASFLADAAAAGLDALVTGEAPHHAYHEAMELGINLYLGGHYATETWGVRALGARVAQEFGLEQQFLDLPTGL